VITSAGFTCKREVSPWAEHGDHLFTLVAAATFALSTQALDGGEGCAITVLETAAPSPSPHLSDSGR
jgi:hypothetical protein